MPQTAELKKQEIKKLVTDTLAQLTNILKNSGMSEDDKVGQITDLVTQLNDQVEGKIDEAIGQQTVTVAPGQQVAPQEADDNLEGPSLEELPLEPIPTTPVRRKVKKDRSFGDMVKYLAGKSWAEVSSWFGNPDNRRAWDEAQANAVAGVRGSEIFRDVAIKHAKKDKLKGGAGDDVEYDEMNKKQLEMGQKVEMEHTNDPEIAKEIAGDHLAEQLKGGKDKEEQDYYTELKKMDPHEDEVKDKKPAFWRRNLDYGTPR